jgi:coproporphyrinogen III oxidase
MQDLELKKETASNWFRTLRDDFCRAFQELDNSTFKRKKWNHKGSGGGEMSIMKGDVFEKVGVNISTVSGQFSEEYRNKIKGTKKLTKLLGFRNKLGGTYEFTKGSSISF